MIQDDIDSLKFRVIEESMEYSMFNYSDWREITDKTFHELKRKYKEAHRELSDYIFNNLKADDN